MDTYVTWEGGDEGKRAFLERFRLRKDRRSAAAQVLQEAHAEYARVEAARREAWQAEAEKRRVAQREFMAAARAAHVTVSAEPISDEPPADFMPLPAAPPKEVTVVSAEELWGSPTVAMDGPSAPKTITIPAEDVPALFRRSRGR
jgi:hypothetical protein